VVLGAGVIGLTVAHVLSFDPSNEYNITVIARDMPEDLDSQAWASPWAGANWSPMPMGGLDENIKKWETVTFNKFWDMIPTGLVKMLPLRAYSSDADAFVDPWYKDLPRDFRALSPDEIPSNYKSGIGFSTISVNPADYLPWLKLQLEPRGVKFIRKKLRSIGEAADVAGPEGIIINATSLGARSLIGVQDTKLFPARGQTIIVHAPQLHECLIDTGHHPNGGVTYIIPRPGGTVTLGGTFQPYNWDTSYSEKTAQEMFSRCVALAPSLLDKEKTQVLSHNVGLRPMREGGPRVEAEWIEMPLKGDLVPYPQVSASQARKVAVVHAYGFGPAGYQQSWGAAAEVVALLKSSASRTNAV